MTTATTDRLLTLAYDMERAGQLAAAAALRAQAHQEAPAALDADEEPFGQLADGTPMCGVLDRPGGPRAGVVRADLDDWHLIADDAGAICITGVADDSNPFQAEAMTMATLASLRALLNSGACEQLLAAAACYGRGDAAPPVAAPAVRVEPTYHDLGKGGDHTDQPIGPLAFNDFYLGDDDSVTISISVTDNEPPSAVLLGGDRVGLDQAEQAIANLHALRNSPEVIAALAADAARRNVA